jgi:uncharacterized membrane protein
MEGIVILIVVLLGLLVVLPIIAIVLARQAAQRLNEVTQSLAELTRRFNRLDQELIALRKPGETRAPDRAAAQPAVQATSPAAAPHTSAKAHPVETMMVLPELAKAAKVLAPPPVIPPSFESKPTLMPVVMTTRPEPQTASAGESPAPAIQWSAINWEQFLGVKLFAWVGGLALFLGVGFLVKYSFEQGLISPPIRVAMGLVIGLGLLVGGLLMSRKKYAPTVQALCSAGLLILYADIFAACSFYHFLPEAVAFLCMVLVTATAFMLAVRLDAPAVAILALLGGFLTPPLLSTGKDNPVGLFGYLAILDVGLIAVAFRKRWGYLILLAAIATIVMQAGWVHKFFEAQKAGIAVTVFLGFTWLFVLALGRAHQTGKVEKYVSAAAILMPGTALAFAFYLLTDSYPAIAHRPGLLLGFIMGADLGLLVVAWLRTELRAVQLGAAAAVFLLLTIWTLEFLTPELLPWALGFYLGFGVLHAVFPVVVERLRPAGTPAWWAQLFAPLALLLVMIPMFKLAALSLAIWPVVLILDALAIAIASLTASVVGILAVLLLTVLATAFWIVRLPAVATGLPETLFIIGGFAIFFFSVGIAAVRKRLAGLTAAAEARSAAGWLPSASIPAEAILNQIPALAAILPFLLLTMVTLRMTLPDPSPVFGLAALLLVLLLGLVRYGQTEALSAIGLASVLMVEFTWHLRCFDAAQAVVPLAWYIGFYAAFGLFPFLFQRQKTDRLIPWAVAALAGPAHFFLVYRLVNGAFPNSWMGLLPALFAVPALAALVQLLRALPAEAAQRNTLLALFGGVALFFITLVFPIQFERQWLTIAWALEGAALLWLFHRVPHEGLRIVGVGLLVTSFVRLALNPAVFHYHQRSETPILNWFLYAYGVVVLCHFVAARLLAPPRHLLQDVNVPPLLEGLGTVLAFLLMNIEIADYFSTGTTVVFQFSGSFARDMTYSLGWAAFAFVLLTVGIHRQARAARYGGIGLLSATLVKLFLHDLWSLGGLYRIGSLIGLALVLIPVSFLYQRFLAAAAEKQPKENS